MKCAKSNLVERRKRVLAILQKASKASPVLKLSTSLENNEASCFFLRQTQQENRTPLVGTWLILHFNACFQLVQQHVPESMLLQVARKIVQEMLESPSKRCSWTHLRNSDIIISSIRHNDSETKSHWWIATKSTLEFLRVLLHAWTRNVKKEE